VANQVGEYLDVADLEFARYHIVKSHIGQVANVNREEGW
jgi:hypothetical protein